ncbi:MAG: thiamine diphosphokinase [Firmicutes bacterium]|nr:thiamine diphosphokinase [Bacillota bacterium]
MKRVLIIAGGLISDKTDLKVFLNDDLYVIAADRGAENAVIMDIMPDLIIGDMDSVKPEILNYFESRGTVVKRFPVHKDKSDLELAFDEAQSMEPDEVIVIGYAGARTDHFLFNIMVYLNYADMNIRFVDGFEEMIPAKMKMEITGHKDATVSIIPLTPVLEDVTIEGFRYPLNGENLFMGSTRGLSNVLTDPPGKISFKSGNALLVINRKV